MKYPIFISQKSYNPLKRNYTKNNYKYLKQKYNKTTQKSFPIL